MRIESVIQVGRLLSKKLGRGQPPRKSAHILTAKEEKVHDLYPLSADSESVTALVYPATVGVSKIRMTYFESLNEV